MAKSQAWQILASVALFMLAGPLLVIVNKKILRDNGLQMPAFVSALGIIFTAIFTRLMVAMGQVKVKRSEGNMFRKLLPVGLASAGTFMFGNMSYIYLDAGFIQMLKAGTPALLLFMLVTFKIEGISKPVAFFVLLMVGGSALAVAKSPTYSVMGLSIMILSEICEGARCVLTQMFLQKLEFTVWDAGYYMAPVTAGCCLMLSLVTEWSLILSEGDFSLVASQVPLFMVSGCIGIAVNFASFLLIKLTSSLLTKLLVAARNAGLVLFFVIQGEPWTGMEVFGYLITVVAFTGYSVTKVLESRRPKPKVETDKPLDL